MTKYREDYSLIVNGNIVLCSDGKITTTDEFLSAILFNVFSKSPVSIKAGLFVVPSLDPNDRIGLYAALVSPAPGRVKIIHVPDTVQDYLLGKQGLQQEEEDV